MEKYLYNKKKNKLNSLREFNKDKYLTILKKNPKSLLEADSFFFKNQKSTNLLNKFNKNKFIIYKVLKFFLKKTKSRDIVEFGCGYGSIGLFLSQKIKFKKLRFFLTDISVNGLKIIKKISTNKNVKTKVLDVYNSKKKINFGKNPVAITHSAMHYKTILNYSFINFLKINKFSIVIHFEPVYEFYNKNSLKDKKIINYINKNKYTKNFYTILKRAEKIGTIKIIMSKKNFFNNLNSNLPLSLIVYKMNN